MHTPGQEASASDLPCTFTSEPAFQAGCASCSKLRVLPSRSVTLVTHTVLLLTCFCTSLPAKPPATAPPTVATVLPVPLPIWLPRRPPTTAPPTMPTAPPEPLRFSCLTSLTWPQSSQPIACIFF